MDNTKDLKKELDKLTKRVKLIEDYLIADKTSKSSTPIGEYEDELYPKAEKIIKDYDFVSASLLQRTLIIGYSRAARILDQLEENGLVGPAEGAKPRKVIKK